MAVAVLIVTKQGLGKLVDPYKEFTPKGRGGRGVSGFKVAEGDAVAAIERVETGGDQKVLIVTAQGMALFTKVDDIGSLRSRTAGGVKLINVAEGDEVVAVLV